MKDTLGIASSANNIAFVLYKQKKYDQALPYFEQARVLFGYKKDFYNSTIININIGNLYSDINKPEKATPYFAEAQIMAQKSVSPEMKLEVYNAFYKFHKKYNRISEALDNYEKFIKLQDSIFSEKRKTEFAELETKYETEKKEQENALLRAKDEKNIAVIKQQRNLTWFILTALVLIAAFAVFVLRTAKIRKQMNTMLVHKNTEINQQKEEIQTQNDMLLSQKEEIMAYAENMEKANFHISNQNEKLERINHNIKSSINYASKIQNAMLPENSRFSQFFADHFIVFKPRDIVSGDFYYVKEVNDYIIFAVGDCTGHGVPGAFVSMLAISLLNELILRREINQAAQLLDVMRDEIKKSLNQKGEQGETKDGLDIALCVINKSSLQLQYAGAHNSAYVFRQSDGGFENFEFKPDKQPIGINRLELPFTNTDFQAQKGDRIYLFSDGFLDQFNDKSEKYKISRFRNFLTHIQAKPFTEHKSIFDQEFESWKGSTEQIDDVTVIGLVI
jgi:serine phosphatase RsbU (regulator of sigma subunit)